MAAPDRTTGVLGRIGMGDRHSLTARELLAKLQPLIALGLMVLALSLAAPTFRTHDNVLNILREISVNLCLSLGAGCR